MQAFKQGNRVVGQGAEPAEENIKLAVGRLGEESRNIEQARVDLQTDQLRLLRKQPGPDRPGGIANINIEGIQRNGIALLVHTRAVHQGIAGFIQQRSRRFRIKGGHLEFLGRRRIVITLVGTAVIGPEHRRHIAGHIGQVGNRFPIQQQTQRPAEQLIIQRYARGVEYQSTRTGILMHQRLDMRIAAHNACHQTERQPSQIEVAFFPFKDRHIGFRPLQPNLISWRWQAIRIPIIITPLPDHRSGVGVGTHQAIGTGMHGIRVLESVWILTFPDVLGYRAECAKASKVVVEAPVGFRQGEDDRVAAFGAPFNVRQKRRPADTLVRVVLVVLQGEQPVVHRQGHAIVPVGALGDDQRHFRTILIVFPGLRQPGVKAITGDEGRLPYNIVETGGVVIGRGLIVVEAVPDIIVRRLRGDDKGLTARQVAEHQFLILGNGDAQY